MGSNLRFTRRGFLQACALTGGALALKDVFLPALARGADDKPRYLLFCYFSGGWDQLLALDPRDQTRTEFLQENAYGRGKSGIFPAYGNLTDADSRALLGSNTSGVQKAGALTFGPAVHSELLKHASELCIVRGLDMGTLTHEVGRRYFITGKFPRGLQASGSALPTAVTALVGDSTEIPNLSVGVETYNETFPQYASGITVSNPNDVVNILKALNKALPAGSRTALLEYEQSADSCLHHELDGDGTVTQLKESRRQALKIVESRADAHFAFTTNVANQTPEIKELFQHFNVVTSTDLSGARGQAALAAQALTNGISQAVALQLATGIDDHDDDWESQHAPALRNGFFALGKLITWLKGKQDPRTGESFWSTTTLLCFSEFARTPLINARGGRDHHLASSCLLAGPGIAGNKVIGATADVNMAVQKLDLRTGLVDPGGVAIRPADVHATVLESMGLSWRHIDNQEPRIITAMLR